TWTVSLRDWAVERGVEAVASGRVEDTPGAREPGWSVDLVVSVTYNRILKEAFLRRAGKALNIHNGSLPQYRGVNPINWALKNGECRHGVTIHEMTPGIDDGPIVAQRLFAIDPAVDEVIDVYERCLDQGWELFQETMPRLWQIEPQPQDESLARYYSAADFERLGERRFFTRAESA
ncbi:MAG TPA: formyltransferase family protein, partial [Dehalococcoidia bacterium]|nr:formyltransferase family protein [Dehalococcoidia bacterium]